MSDKYFEWLMERKRMIINNVNDEVFKKVLLDLHKDYAENYIILKEDK